MQLINLNQINPVLEDKSAVLEAVRQGFIQHSQGKIRLPEPVQMLFGVTQKVIAGDCHIKTASSETLPYFCIKVATGFYGNPAKGLPVNNGLVMLMSSDTGAPLALFQDNGHLTSIRTAAAGALAACLLQEKTPVSLGIVGTGHQAELQAFWISETCKISNIIIWGRSEEKAKALKIRLESRGLQAELSASISDLCARSRIIVTTTPSTSPLIFSKDLKPGHHIIAMGSDSPGKIELEPEIIKRADVMITDDHEQCLHHGELGHAVKAGLVEGSKDISLGEVLQNPSALSLTRKSISVVDLTGLGAQDLAMASMVYDKISEAG